MAFYPNMFQYMLEKNFEREYYEGEVTGNIRINGIRYEGVKTIPSKNDAVMAISDFETFYKKDDILYVEEITEEIVHLMIGGQIMFDISLEKFNKEFVVLKSLKPLTSDPDEGKKVYVFAENQI